MGQRVVSDPTFVEADGLAVEEVGESLIGCGGVTQRTGGEINATRKVLIQFPIESEAHPDTAAIAIKKSGLVLELALAADPDIAAQPESSN